MRYPSRQSRRASAASFADRNAAEFPARRIAGKDTKQYICRCRRPFNTVTFDTIAKILSAGLRSTHLRDKPDNNNNSNNNNNNNNNQQLQEQQ